MYKTVYLILLVSMVTVSQGHKHRPCWPPDNTSLKAQWLNYTSANINLSHESQFLSPYLDYIVMRHLEDSSHPERNQCVQPERMGVSGHLSGYSDCPWHLVYNTDTTRFPQTLVQAVCNCDNCLSINNSLYSCVPIHFPVRVLRKSDRCHQGVYKYDKSWHKVAIGCTCVRKGTGENPVSGK